MTTDRPDTGVLVVRAERQDDHVLYSVVADVGTPDLGDVGSEPKDRRATTDPAEVVRAVTEFLDRF